MKRSGAADLPLHNGHVPQWLAQRMARLGLAVTEVLLAQFGKAEVLRRLSDPFWFQSLGAVMGMDWHSSGITTSVMGALKKSINPLSRELGIYICGGKGASSRQAPEEIRKACDSTGLDAAQLVRCSKLSAKVDSDPARDECDQFDGPTVSLAFCRAALLRGRTAYGYLRDPSGRHPQSGGPPGLSRAECRPFHHPGKT